MTTNAHDSDDDADETHPTDGSPDDGIEFTTISSFDKFATLSNNIDQRGSNGQNKVRRESAEYSAPQNASDNSIVSSGSSYQLITEVARSSRAVIYKARQLSSIRLVVFKLFLTPTLSPSQLDQFLADMMAARDLAHPGIVSVYDTGYYNGNPFVCMEHIDGCSLSDHVKDGPLPPRHAAEILLQIAEALSFAHDHGVVHGYLTPSDVLCDIRMAPRIAGFGQASLKFNYESLDNVARGQGDAAFLSPEQTASPNISQGPATDIYGAGAILYYMLTARPPFPGSNPAETLRQIAEEDAVSPRLLNRQVPLELEAICRKCLSKTPTLRYSGVTEIIADLQRWLNGESVPARQAVKTQSGAPWTWPPFLSSVRNALMILLAGVGLLLVVKYFQDRATLRELRQSLQTMEAAGEGLETLTRKQAEAQEQMQRSLQAVEAANRDALLARQAEEQASQLADKARAELLETKELITKAEADLEFLKTSAIVAKLETGIETVRQLGLKGDFDEAIRQIEELISANVGTLPISMRDEKTKVLESLREEMLKRKNTPQ